MGESSWPSPAYNSGAVTEDEYERLAAEGYMPSGAYGVPTDPPLVFGDSSGRQVKFRATRSAMVRGQRWSSDGSGVTKTITANSSGQTRFDLATLRLDRSTQLVTAHIVTGTPGSGTPSPVQDAPGSGVWDEPYASVRVINGASTIAAADVTPLGWYLGEPVYLCTSSTRPPHRFGRKIRESDTGNELTSNGTQWVTKDSDTGPLSWTVQPGWSLALNEVSKLNGVVLATLQVQRGGGSLNPGTDSPVAKLPASCAPAAQKDVVGVAGAGIAVRGRIDAGTGLLNITDYATAIASGNTISFHQITFRP